jgi:hypothetical protein
MARCWDDLRTALGDPPKKNEILEKCLLSHWPRVAI